MDELANGMSGKIIEVNDNDLTLCGTSDEVFIYTIKNELREDLIPGMLVETKFKNDFKIEQTFPQTINGEVEDIIVLNEGNDYINLYIDIIDSIYKEEYTTNPINMISLDLKEEFNLTENERVSLAYLLEKKYNVPIHLFDYRELLNNGYIENNSFKDGLLIEITSTLNKNDYFDFTISKWNEGLSTYYYRDCIALKEDNIWRYEIGYKMIS